jgi:hypothetical protein
MPTNSATAYYRSTAVILGCRQQRFSRQVNGSAFHHYIGGSHKAAIGLACHFSVQLIPALFRIVDPTDTGIMVQQQSTFNALHLTTDMYYLSNKATDSSAYVPEAFDHHLPCLHWLAYIAEIRKPTKTYLVTKPSLTSKKISVARRRLMP